LETKGEGQGSVVPTETTFVLKQDGGQVGVVTMVKLEVGKLIGPVPRVKKEVIILYLYSFGPLGL